MTNIINLFLLCGFNLFLVEASSDTGPIGPVTIYDFQECDPPVDAVGAQIIHKQDIDQKDKATLSFSLPFDVEADTTVTVDADKFDGSDWQKSAVTFENQLFFKFLSDFVPVIWNNLREQIQPPIKEVNRIPAGDYNLDLFYANYMDINTPQVAYGRFMASFYITVNDEDVMCQKVEVEFSPPPGSK